MAINLVESWKGLEIQNIQADELHSFVGARQKNVGRMLAPNGEAGEIWGYLAVCAKTKLVFAYHLGDHSSPEATIFMKSVASKLKRAPDKSFSLKPNIITDGLKAYPKAFEAAFGSDANYAILSKQYTNTDKDGEPTFQSKYEGAVRIQKVGEVPFEDIHTSYVERQNLNVRMQNRRYTMDTNAFSKTMLNHKRHLALWIVYHNFCWVPCPLRPTRAERLAGKKNWSKRVTAALAAGLTDRHWEVEDLLDLMDAFNSARNKDVSATIVLPVTKAIAAPINEEATDAGGAPYWVYHSFVDGNRCKVHASSCSNCRGGAGKKAGAQKSGQWIPFYDLDEAKAYADKYDESTSTVCQMCIIGKYKTGGRYSKNKSYT